MYSLSSQAKAWKVLANDCVLIVGRGCADGVPVASARPQSLYGEVTPQDSSTSTSGFYSPRSQMPSRRQSASSSEAWLDATSQMASRASSVTAPGSGLVGASPLLSGMPDCFFDRSVTNTAGLHFTLCLMRLYCSVMCDSAYFQNSCGVIVHTVSKAYYQEVHTNAKCLCDSAHSTTRCISCCAACLLVTLHFCSFTPKPSCFAYT